MRSIPMLFLCLLVLQLDVGAPFATPSSWTPNLGRNCFSRRWQQRLHAVAGGDTTISNTFTYQSIFNFTNVQENAVSKFERIDDAVSATATDFHHITSRRVL
jgi:hypothetical protein